MTNEGAEREGWGSREGGTIKAERRKTCTKEDGMECRNEEAVRGNGTEKDKAIKERERKERGGKKDEERRKG
jgi:hypothetical protein